MIVLSIENIIMFIISTIGMCHVIVDGSIFESFRNYFKLICKKLKIEFFGGLVDCYLCCGVWCGFFTGYVWISNDVLKIFACGCAGGFVSSFASFLINWIEASTMINLKIDVDKEEDGI